MDHEAALAAAIADLESQETPNYSATAEKHSVSRITLWRRFTGQAVSRAEAASRYKKVLTTAQEKKLLLHIKHLTERGYPPTPKIVENLVVEIVKKPIGTNWVSKFCKRYKQEIQSLYLQNIDSKRKTADNVKYYKHYYEQLAAKIEKYNIEPSNIYNFDEKGFMLGICRTTKRIVNIESLKSRRVLGASQDGSREFISLLSAVCCDGTQIPPALIYKGESRDMQDTWLEDFGDKDEAYFASSSNGWSNDDYGLEWLEKIFNRHTQAKAGRGKRFLILDGHSSHINMKFIEYANSNGIILGILPPHSTHRLQPLDVAIFGPLSTAYSQAVDDYIRSGFGFVRMTKRDFWRLFKIAWDKAVTPANIAAGFEATGIHPLNPERVLQAVRRPITPPEAPKPAAAAMPVQTTPTDLDSLRTAVYHFYQGNQALIYPILRGSEALALENEMYRIKNEALAQQLCRQRLRQQRGKALGLLDEDNPGAQFFSPARVQRVREQLHAEELAKQERTMQAEQVKLQRAIEKDCKAAELEQRRVEREQARALAKEQREAEKQAKAAQREVQKLEREAKKARLQQEKQQRAAERAAKQAAKRAAEVLQPPPTKRLRKTASTAQPYLQTPIQPSKLGSKASSSTPGPNSPLIFPRSVRPNPFIENLLDSKSARSGRTIRPSTRLFY